MKKIIIGAIVMASGLSFAQNTSLVQDTTVVKPVLNAKTWTIFSKYFLFLYCC